MKSLTLLWQKAALDCAAWCCASTIDSDQDLIDMFHIDKDLDTLIKRSCDEGVSFLTITLTDFGKDFEKSLSQGFVDSKSFLGFHRGKTCLPRFLSGFTSLVFDLSTGTLLDNPSIAAIFSVRQLTLMFGKILLPCSDTREKNAISGYIQVEKEIRELDRNGFSDTELAQLRNCFEILFRESLNYLTEKLDNYDLHPKHGPGSTADRLLGNKKYTMATWPDRLERIFPYVDYALPNHRYSLEYLERVEFLAPDQEIPVRVISVPKTLKTPRIIAIEPTAMQYMQQALARIFMDTTEKSFIRNTPYGDVYVRPLSAGFIGFEDQEPNQLLAQKGSKDGSLATIDLSEASDRVSNSLVRALFLNYPQIAEAIDSTRSRKASIPGYGVHRIAKFASMGSALTFPIESMVFLSIIFYSISKERGVPVSEKFVKQFLGKVRVYGDDIVVPTEYARSVIQCLEAFGFKVNSNKSFWTGKFRESCGKEFYDGCDVSLTRVRREIPTSRSCVEGVISTVSLSNQFYKAGLWRSADYLANILGKFIPLPIVGEESPALGLHSFQGYKAERVCKRLHRPLVWAAQPSAKSPLSKLNGVFALQKILLTSGFLPNPDRSHLERNGRPDAVDIKLGWIVAY